MKTSTARRAGMLALVLAAGAFTLLPRTFAKAQGDSANRAPRVTALFSAADMPHTERVVAVGQRLFVTSDANLFEVLDEPHGKLRKVSIAQASVTLGDGQSVPAAFLALAAHGRVLYATATAFTEATIPYASMLYRIELGARPGEVASIESTPFTGHATPFLPNGMAVDRDGDIFMSNSFSAATGEAAIVKIKVRLRPFAFRESNWLLADQGGAFPNGVQLDGNTLYLASLSALLRVTIEREGNAGQVSTLYAANPDDFLDDFAVRGNELVVCEIDNPFAPPVSSTSQLTVVSKTGPSSGTVTKVVPLAAAGVHPSSVIKEGASHGELLVTDYGSGGLYSVSF